MGILAVGRALLFGFIMAVAGPCWQVFAAEDLGQLLAREQQLMSNARGRPGTPERDRELAALRAAIGEAQAKAGDKKSAADYLYNSLQLDPGHPDRWELLGDLANFVPGPSSTAVVQYAYEEALTREPGRVLARLKLASSYLSSERYSDAAGQFETVIEASGDKPNVEHLKLLGAAYAMSGQLARGSRFFEERHAATGHDEYRIAGKILAHAAASAEETQ